MRTALIEMLGRKAGRNVTTPHGSEWLRNDIVARTGEQISVNTVKRLTGVLNDYTDGKIHMRTYNLDILARYLGYGEWADLVAQKAG